MSVALQSHLAPKFTSSVYKIPRFSLPVASAYLTNPLHFQIPNHKLQYPFNPSPLRPRHSRVGVFDSRGVVSGNDGFFDFDFDSFLSAVELLCLVSSAVISIGFAVNVAFSSLKKTFLVVVGDRIVVWGLVLLVVGVSIGAWIRRRQWRRVCGVTVKGALEVNLVERIEKLEEDLRSSATVIRALSRQLEKLGIRFRVTRKALKEPIAETAVLAQKNSEATRALAVQEDILEKELGEIQKVLLAMQEQQQKQLELILAIGKTGKLFESRNGPNPEQTVIEKHDIADKGLIQKEAHQI